MTNNFIFSPILQKIIDRLSGYIFPIAFAIVNAAYGMAPTDNTESQGINIQNYLDNFRKL